MKKTKIVRVISETVFFLAGVVMLASLPFLEVSHGRLLWVVAKVAYFVGLVLFVTHFIINRYGHKH